MEPENGHLPFYMSTKMMVEFTGESPRISRAELREIKKEYHVKKVTIYHVSELRKISIACMMWHMPDSIIYSKRIIRKKD